MKSLLRTTALLALALTAALAMGQVTTGTLQGTITDPSGAVVPNAKVTAVNASTQFSRSATTNPDGTYTLPGLPPGTYDVTIQAGNFASQKRRVDVTVGSRNGLDVPLALSSAGTVVEVVGESGTTVNTIDQQESSVVSAQQVANLPTLTRDPYALVATASNVNQDSQAGTGDARGAGFSINGQRSASTDIMLDGVENVDQFTATVGQTVPQDSVQEFRVVTNGMTAEYGRAAGGVVNVATKSGTNSFHGSAYEYNRISALAGNTYDNAANGVAKSVFTRNQFGGSLGGPIIKNKLFFFDNVEWLRVRSSAPQITEVPDPAFIALANANTKSFFTSFGKLRPDLRSAGAPLTQAQVVAAAGGASPLFAAIPAGTPIFDVVQYNAPTDAGGGNPQNTLMDVARVDFNFTDKTQMFARYSIFDERDFPGVINTSPYVGFETGQTNYDQNVMLSVTHTFGNNLLSNTRLVWSRLNNVQPLGTAPVGPTLYMSNARAVRIGSHHVAFPGYNEYTPGSAIPFGGPQNLGEIYEDISLVHRAHTFRFGGQYIRTQDNRAFGAYEEAVEALSTTSNSQALDNFLSGNLALFQAAVFPQGKFPCTFNLATGTRTVTPACTVNLPVGPPSFSRSNLYNDGAVYAQDTWKVSPQLTLDLGLRWEYYGVQHNRNPNLDSNFYYGPGATIFDQIRTGFVALAPQSPIGGLWKPRYHNFGPRIGFALDPFANGRWALRGGYGISYERNFNNVTYNVIQNPPNYAVLSLQPTDVAGVIPVTPNNAGPLAGNVGTAILGRTSLRNVDQNIKTAYAEQWNLTVEHQLANNAVVSVGYNGSRGIHQYSISNTNDNGFAPLYLGDTKNLRLDPQYSNINNRGSLGDSWYNALVLGLRGNIFRDLQMTANYTWSHSIDTLSSTFSDEVQNNGLGYLDPFNPSLDKASSDYDARHRVAVSLVWTLPGTRSASKFIANTIGGFQFAPIFTFHTGYPFTVFDCTNSAAAYNCPRANVTGPYGIQGSTSGGDTGGNLYNYLAVPAAVGQYTGPTVIPGTTTPFPNVGLGAGIGGSTLPICTGLEGKGCSYPSNMLHRNAFVAPQVWNWDLGVYKNFKITERVALQLRGEFFDILNHKNFYVLGFGAGGADVSSLGTNAAGQPLIQAKKGGYGNPFDERRHTQLAVRITF